MRVTRIHKRCCGKETFATEEAANLRLRQVHNLFGSGVEGKEPCRAYPCDYGNYHLTSITEAQWERMKAYEQELLDKRAAAPAQPRSQAPLAPVARAAAEAMERDGACIRCSEDQGLVVVARGKAGILGVLDAKRRHVKRNTMMSNLITLCFRCEVCCRNHNQAWEGGWWLEPYMTPERYPVLHHGIWVYLNNDGTITMAEDALDSSVAGDAQEALEAAE